MQLVIFVQVIVAKIGADLQSHHNKKGRPTQKSEASTGFPAVLSVQDSCLCQPVCRPDKVGFDLILGQGGSAAVLLFFELGIHRTLP